MTTDNGSVIVEGDFLVMHGTRLSGGRSIRTVQFGIPWFWREAAHLQIVVGESGKPPRDERVRGEGTRSASVILGEGQSAYVTFCIGRSRIGLLHEVSLRRGRVYYEEKEVPPVIGRRSLFGLEPTIVPSLGKKKEIVG